MKKQPPNTRTHRPCRKPRQMRSTENKCTFCFACSCSSNIETQRYKESSPYAIFEEARKNVTTEPIAKMYAHYRTITGTYGTETDKLMFVLFIEIAVLQTQILNLQTQPQALCASIK